MKQDHSKGFYSEKCYLEASLALCFEWAGYIVPRDVLPNVLSNEHSCSDRVF